MHLKISQIQFNGVDISVFVSCIGTGAPAKKLDDCYLLQGRSRGDYQSWCLKRGCNGDTDTWISTSWSNISNKTHAAILIMYRDIFCAYRMQTYLI